MASRGRPPPIGGTRRESARAPAPRKESRGAAWRRGSSPVTPREMSFEERMFVERQRELEQEVEEDNRRKSEIREGVVSLKARIEYALDDIGHSKAREPQPLDYDAVHNALSHSHDARRERDGITKDLFKWAAGASEAGSSGAAARPVSAAVPSSDLEAERASMVHVPKQYQQEKEESLAMIDNFGDKLSLLTAHCRNSMERMAQLADEKAERDTEVAMLHRTLKQLLELAEENPVEELKRVIEEKDNALEVLRHKDALRHRRVAELEQEIARMQDERAADEDNHLAALQQLNEQLHKENADLRGRVRRVSSQLTAATRKPSDDPLIPARKPSAAPPPQAPPPRPDTADAAVNTTPPPTPRAVTPLQPPSLPTPSEAVPSDAASTESAAVEVAHAATDSHDLLAPGVLELLRAPPDPAAAPRAPPGAPLSRRLPPVTQGAAFFRGVALVNDVKAKMTATCLRRIGAAQRLQMQAKLKAAVAAGEKARAEEALRADGLEKRVGVLTAALEDMRGLYHDQRRMSGEHHALNTEVHAEKARRLSIQKELLDVRDRSVPTSILLDTVRLHLSAVQDTVQALIKWRAELAPPAEESAPGVAAARATADALARSVGRLGGVLMEGAKAEAGHGGEVTMQQAAEALQGVAPVLEALKEWEWGDPATADILAAIERAGRAVASLGRAGGADGGYDDALAAYRSPFESSIHDGDETPAPAGASSRRASSVLNKGSGAASQGRRASKISWRGAGGSRRSSRASPPTPLDIAPAGDGHDVGELHEGVSPFRSPRSAQQAKEELLVAAAAAEARCESAASTTRTATPPLVPPYYPPVSKVTVDSSTQTAPPPIEAAPLLWRGSFSSSRRSSAAGKKSSSGAAAPSSEGPEEAGPQADAARSMAKSDPAADGGDDDDPRWTGRPKDDFYLLSPLLSREAIDAIAGDIRTLRVQITGRPSAFFRKRYVRESLARDAPVTAAVMRQVFRRLVDITRFRTLENGFWCALLPEAMRRKRQVHLAVLIYRSLQEQTKLLLRRRQTLVDILRHADVEEIDPRFTILPNNASKYQQQIAHAARRANTTRSGSPDGREGRDGGMAPHAPFAPPLCINPSRRVRPPPRDAPNYDEFAQVSAYEQLPDGLPHPTNGYTTWDHAAMIRAQHAHNAKLNTTAPPPVPSAWQRRPQSAPVTKQAPAVRVKSARPAPPRKKWVIPEPATPPPIPTAAMAT